MAESPCKLLGGPYDGDQGSMYEPLPGVIWAYPCPHGGGRNCNHGGIHWTSMQEKADQDDEGVELYRHSHVDAGLHIYTWADLDLEPLASEKEAELVGA